MLDTVPWCTCPHSQASLGSPGAAVQGSCRLDPHHEVGHVAPDALFPGTCSGCFRAERQPPTDCILPCPRLVCCHLRAIGALRCLRSTSRRCHPPQSLSRLLAPCPRTLLTGWWRATVRYTLLGESTSLHGAAVVESLWDGTRNTSRRAAELFRLRLTLAPAGHTPLHAVRTRYTDQLAVNCALRCYVWSVVQGCARTAHWRVE